METKMTILNMCHLTADTIDTLRRQDIANSATIDNRIPGMVVQFTTSNDILITIDRDIINTNTLAQDAITSTLNIPSDLRLCLFYVFDHDCDALHFTEHITGINPLLPAYTKRKNSNGDSYIEWIDYNATRIQFKDWPCGLLSD